LKLEESTIANTPLYKTLENKYLLNVEENARLKEEIEKYKRDYLESTNQRRHDKENIARLRENQKKTYTNKIEAVEVKLKQLCTEKEQLILEIEKLKVISPLRHIIDRRDKDISNLENSLQIEREEKKKK